MSDDVELQAWGTAVARFNGLIMGWVQDRLAEVARDTPLPAGLLFQVNKGSVSRVETSGHAIALAVAALL